MEIWFTDLNEEDQDAYAQEDNSFEGNNDSTNPLTIINTNFAATNEHSMEIVSLSPLVA